MTVEEHTMAADVAVAEVHHEWVGDNPFFLFIVRENTQNTKIDLDYPGWAQIWKDWIRGVRSRWYMCRKDDDRVVFGMEVYPDDQPFCGLHHNTYLNGPLAGVDFVAYGMGAKHADGSEDALWITSDGLVCNGRDVDTLMRG